MASQWGRIDDDGTVFVHTAAGERAIGSWQAGDAADGLAYYERRYADLVTEVELLRRRLDSGAGDAKATWAQAASMQDALVDAAVIGDLDALATSLTELRAAAEAKLAEQLLARDAARAAAVATKEALVAEAEALAVADSHWKAAGDRMRAIVEDWKKVKGIDRKTDEALWKRYATARDEFGRRRGQHFAGLDAERTQVKAAKEKMIAEAEKLSTSTDWRETGESLKRLMTEWKDAGRTSKSEEDALWKRFRAAQDAFFTRRTEVFSERDAEQTANQRQKEALLAEAESLDTSDPRKAQARLRDIGERFDAVGHVPREAIRRLDERMRAAEARVRSAAETSRATSTPSVTNPFLAAMLERVAEAEAKVERARKSGDDARIAKAEQDLAQRKALLPS